VQCEITQILGDIDDAHDIGPHDVLLMGLVTVCTRSAERCIPVNTPQRPAQGLLSMCARLILLACKSGGEACCLRGRMQ
jgi:hypothetical protein